MISSDKKAAIIEQFKRHEGDTGSPEVQVAILSARIASSPSISRSTRMTTIPGEGFTR